MTPRFSPDGKFVTYELSHPLSGAFAAIIKEREDLKAINTELIEALEELVNDESPDYIPHKKWANARAAIAAATKDDKS